MTERVLVVGAGGHAKVVVDVLRAAGWQVAGVFDDDPARRGTTFRGATVVGAVGELADYAARHGIRHFIVAIGNNEARLCISLELEASGLLAVAAVHPSVLVAPGVEIGAGTVVMPRVCLNADTRIGRHAIINTAASVDHDCVIADGVHIAPGSVLCGDVQVGEAAFLGAGVVVMPGRRIGARVRIGAGASVIRDIPADTTAVGVPARPLTKQGD